MQQLPTFPTVSPDDGVERTVLSEAPELMVVSFRFKTGAEGKLHSHPHVQSTYVASGSLCLEEGELIDCFTPRRDDFL